jgi:hypothetical protein
MALCTACAATIELTERGAAVRQVASRELPPDCRLVGDVPIGIPPDAARPRTREQLAILMRNKAAEMGANHLVLEHSEERGFGDRRHYVGRGLAYACREGSASQGSAASP